MAFVNPPAEPYEATRLPSMPPDPVVDDAIRAVVTAVCGFPYIGDGPNAIVGAVRWLRTRPDAVRALGLSLPDPYDSTADPGFNEGQHCTNDACIYTGMSHTATYCGARQPRRCGCAFCYPTTDQEG